jgi:predicted acyltransferase
MRLVETSSRLEPVALPLPTAVSAQSELATVRERLVSLDAMRGFAVIGMIVVNALATSKDAYGFQPDYSFLSHSPWVRFTFADFVFPAFIFMAGFSVAVSLRRVHLDWRVLRRIGARTTGLMALGFLLTNITWFGDMDHGDWRLLGVLHASASATSPQRSSSSRAARARGSCWRCSFFLSIGH